MMHYLIFSLIEIMLWNIKKNDLIISHRHETVIIQSQVIQAKQTSV